LIDPPGSGPWNMAVDEVLMEWSARASRCCLRFYRWEEPTLSLGYFQAYEDRERHRSSLGCPVVRRTSGGGAIVHDRELTYSVVLPRGHRLAMRRLVLYRAIHAALIEALSERGITGCLFAGSGETPSGRQPFLCFQRRAPGDVLVGRIKIAGSAQRRSPGAVLQHGSVLLARSPAAPELPGLNNLVEPHLEATQLLEVWLDTLSQRLGLECQTQPLEDPEWRSVANLAESKYAAPVWTRSRGR
jgi:lipoate-protein ligase A